MLEIYFKKRKVIDIDFVGDIFILIYEKGYRDFLTQEYHQDYIKLYEKVLKYDFSEYLPVVTHNDFQAVDRRRNVRDRLRNV